MANPSDAETIIEKHKKHWKVRQRGFPLKPQPTTNESKGTKISDI